ncbi:hypothetical protein A2791_04960 [Candidatus Saccharibacteria bacterium RIFCSPHIGHO2_01_FULL_46_30]|nr:MAG: hypothetical protein A2791_04960 [Candidatus Saccharibacteria bacterium RIFCSPHIGHO2_01_FULL_46_30]
MLKSLQELRSVTRTVIVFSIVAGVVSLLSGSLILYIAIVEPGGGSMAAYAWVFPLMISGGLTILLTIAAVPLNLIAALTEPSMKGKKICYTLCFVFLCVLCIALLRISGIG